MNKIRNWFFDIINKIYKPLAKLTKEPRGSIQINKIGREKGNIITESEEIQKSSAPTTEAYIQQNWKI